MVDCLLVNFWTCMPSLFGILSFRGVNISLYCFSIAFMVALSTFATAFSKSKNRFLKALGKKIKKSKNHFFFW